MRRTTQLSYVFIKYEATTKSQLAYSLPPLLCTSLLHYYILYYILHYSMSYVLDYNFYILYEHCWREPNTELELEQRLETWQNSSPGSVQRNTSLVLCPFFLICRHY